MLPRKIVAHLVVSSRKSAVPYDFLGAAARFNLQINNRLFVLLLMAITCSCGTYRPGESSRPVVSHTPAIVATSQQQGRLDPAQELDLRIVLPLNNEAELDQLLADQQNPSSPEYHQYVRPEDFALRFHPSQEQIDGLRKALAAEGFETASSAHGAFLSARATARTAETFFHTQLYNYVAPDGTHFFAPASDVTIPDNLPIVAVTGLHTAHQWRSHAVLADEARVNATTHQAAINPAPALTASDIRSVYNIPNDATGKGQVLALLELDGYIPSDITAYETLYNLPQTPLVNILVDNYNGAAGNGETEVALDIELMIALAPYVAQIRVYEAANASNGLADVANEMANPTLGDRTLPGVISCSWDSPESRTSLSDAQTESFIFKQMAAQGQTLYVASGDAGATADGHTLGTDDPASQPYVVAVGGTSLHSAAGQYQSESTWSKGGGGISSFWQIPSWQQALGGQSNSKGSKTMRNVPDVSLNADTATGYSVVVSGGEHAQFGGTSCAAPLWAAFTALVNEQRAMQNLEPMGFMAPVLYSLGQNPNYPKLFHDIADNSNNGFYPAVPGYDDATGLGTFNGAALLPALSTGFPRSEMPVPIP